MICSIAVVLLAGVTANAAMSMHSSSSEWTSANLTVDDDIAASSWGYTTATSGWVIYDLTGSGTTTFNTVDIVSRNHASIDPYPNGWTVKTSSTDNSAGWGTWSSIGNTNSLNLMDAQQQLLNVTASTKRYVRFEWTGSWHTYTGWSEFRVYNKPTKVYANSHPVCISTGVSDSYKGADGATTTDATFYGTTGWVILDLGSATSFSQLKVTSRDSGDPMMPKDVKAYVYSNDNPLTGTLNEVGSDTLLSYNDGTVDYFDLTSTQNKRYVKLEWTTSYGSSTGFSELEAVPEPATMTLLLLGLPFAFRRRR